MTKNKDLKRRVRARMEKTGESYTAARAQLAKGPDPSRYAELAGMKDESVEAKTGRTWAGWVEALDAVGAVSKRHSEIAKAAAAIAPEMGGWWAQTVTVGYERIRGLRDKGQQRGTKLYDANKSRTFGVPVARLYAAFGKKQRARWLGDVDLTIRTSQVNRSMRISWPDGTDVHAFFVDKGPEKSSVAIQHRKLASKADVERAKAAWAERFDALKEQLK